ncbi:hypothetical protein [Streptomyces noursei]|nr:hypothetical protein [Streptomyces noursei]
MFSSWAKSLIKQMAREAAKTQAAQKRLKELAAEAAKKGTN